MNAGSREWAKRGIVMEDNGQIKEYEERLKQIREIAKAKENCISYRVLVDTLKDKNSAITDVIIQKAIDEIRAEDIEVVMSEDDEEYDDQNHTDADSFIPADVNITPRSITIDAIVDRLAHGEIDLNPDFQRKGELWSDILQSRLIESLMLKIPLPTFYFDASREDNWVVIDGLQRLTAFRRFMYDKTLRLCGLEYLREFDGYSFDELPRQYYRRIRETQVTIYTVEKGTPDDIVFNIFKRINTGGMVLSPQEIRHALYHGPVTEIIDKMVMEESFKNATMNAIKTERMADREYVTRFIAFTELDYHKDYQGNIDSFLTKALKQVNKYDPKKLERIQYSFNRIMNYCSQIFGKYAFRRVSGDYRRGPVNKAIFELWAICFRDLSDEEMGFLVERKDTVLEHFVELLADRDFSTCLKGGDKYSLEKRVEEAREMLEDILDGK